MISNRFLIAGFLLSAITLVPVVAEAGRGHRHGDNFNINIRDHDGEIITCDDIEVRYGGEDAARAEETLNVGSLSSLKVRTGSHGGIRVVGGASAYSVTACKAAAMASDLGSVRASVRGNEVTADGPDEGRWMVYFLVRVPRNAVLDLQSSNSPIGVRDVNGTLTARVSNGPLSIKNSTGTIDASATNGPISFSGGSGTVKLSATNGPLSVKLTGNSWNGSLDATTANGPVSLKLPEGYNSGVVVETSRGPVSCKAAACYERNVRRSRSNDNDHDSNRRIELGSGPANVRLSTVNGPVSIKEDN